MMVLKIKPLNACPTRLDWARELERDTIAPRWLAHLEECSTCQQVLDQLAADPMMWQETQETLSDRPVELTHITDSIVPLAVEPLRDDLRDPMCEYEMAQLQRLLPVAKHDGMNSNESPCSEPPCEPLARIGRYELERLIGRGGMGLVFRAWDTQLHRVVAVKTLSMSLWSMPAARERFIREGRAAAMLSHPNIVPMYDVINEPPIPALVMQYIAGPTLDEWLHSHGPMPWAQALRIGLQLAEALCAAHAENLVHRDIKPGNVLLEADGTRALLTDFGLVRAIDDVTLTQSGILAGTPQFMSPEQAKGEDVDGRSDLFSLGSLLYYAMTGNAPFRGRESMSVLNALCHTQHVPLCRVAEAVPLEVSRIVDRLLQKQPELRISSSAELRDLLRKLLASEHRLHLKPKRKHNTSLRLIGLCLAGLMATALILLPRWLEPEIAKRNASQPVAPAYGSMMPGGMAMDSDSSMMMGSGENSAATDRRPNSQGEQAGNVLLQIEPTDLDSLSQQLSQFDGELVSRPLALETRVEVGESLSEMLWRTSQEMDQLRGNLLSD